MNDKGEDVLDDVRHSNDLLTVDEVIKLNTLGNTVYDPFSVLISRRVTMGTGNVIYPCVSLLCSNEYELALADENTFHTLTSLDASGGSIHIGSNNQFGEGGFTAKANRIGSSIIIGDGGRYLNGASIFGNTVLGNGSQLIGQITVDGCTLEEGESFKFEDPNSRAGLLKGQGVARNLVVPKGHVIVGSGVFEIEHLELQSKHHPKR